MTDAEKKTLENAGNAISQTEKMVMSGQVTPAEVAQKFVDNAADFAAGIAYIKAAVYAMDPKPRALAERVLASLVRQYPMPRI